MGILLLWLYLHPISHPFHLKRSQALNCSRRRTNCISRRIGGFNLWRGFLSALGWEAPVVIGYPW
jgi:hypothetical protein